jgi:hypothetical protein
VTRAADAGTVAAAVGLTGVLTGPPRAALPIINISALLLVGARAGVPGLRGVGAPGRYIGGAFGGCAVADASEWSRDEGFGGAAPAPSVDAGAALGEYFFDVDEGGVRVFSHDEALAHLPHARADIIGGAAAVPAAWVAELLQRASRNAMNATVTDPGDTEALTEIAAYVVVGAFAFQEQPGLHWNHQAFVAYNFLRARTGYLAPHEAPFDGDDVESEAAVLAALRTLGGGHARVEIAVPGLAIEPLLRGPVLAPAALEDDAALREGGLWWTAREFLSGRLEDDLWELASRAQSAVARSDD